MTKSKGVGRGFGSGGKRPGAGRPRKTGAAVTPRIGVVRDGAGVLHFEEVDAAGAPVVRPVKPKTAKVKPAKKAEPSVPKELRDAIQAVIPSLDDEPEPTLDELESLAKKALRQILGRGPQDGPRVSAAKLVRDWKTSEADRAAEAAGMTGKKAQATATAHAKIAGGGKFSAPPPPPGAVRGPDRMQ